MLWKILIQQKLNGLQHRVLKNALQEEATFYKKAGDISLNFDDGTGPEKVDFIDPLFQTPTLRYFKCKHPQTGRVDNEKRKNI